MRPLPTCQMRYLFPRTRIGVLEALRGINMAHQAHKGLPEPGDFRPGSWRDVVGLLMAFNRVGPDSRHDAAGDVVA